jgi:hypothetical protein
LRPLLFSIAYRMLGSVAEAEDVVQEAFLRRTTTDTTPDNERAFMIAITTRIAIDVLRSARVRREAYVGSWLPEPLVEAEAPSRVETEETISIAMLVAAGAADAGRARGVRPARVVRPRLRRDRRHRRRSEDNCRQILSRARRRCGGRAAALRRPTRRGRRSPRASSPPRATATWTGSSRCSRPTSSSSATAAAGPLDPASDGRRRRGGEGDRRVLRPDGGARRHARARLGQRRSRLPHDRP